MIELYQHKSRAYTNKFMTIIVKKLHPKCSQSHKIFAQIDRQVTCKIEISNSYSFHNEPSKFVLLHLHINTSCPQISKKTATLHLEIKNTIKSCVLWPVSCL